MTPRCFILGLSLLTLSLVGCQSVAPSTPVPTDVLGAPNALSPPIPPIPTTSTSQTTIPIPPDDRCGELKATDLLPLAPHQGIYRFFEGDQTGLDIPFSFSLDTDNPNLWRQELTGQTITWFSRLVDGSIAILREDDLREEVSVRYEPALIVLPAHLSATPMRATSRMTVCDLDDGLLKTAGPCDYQVTYLGTQKLGTWAGVIDVHLVQVHRQIRLPIAKVNVQVITAYQAGHSPQKNRAGAKSINQGGKGGGQVAERVIQTTQALGFFGSRETSETRLVRWTK